MVRLLPLALLGLLTAACRGDQASPTNTSPGSATAPVSAAPPRSAATAASAAAPASAPAAASASASAGSGASADSALFLGPPRLPGTARSDTVKGAGGLLIGVPKGWKAEDVYDVYTVSSFDVNGNNHAMAYYLSGGGLVPAGAPPATKELERLAYILRTVKTTWDTAATEVRVSPAALVGRLVRGHGQSLSPSEGAKDLFAIEVDVPTRKTFVFMGSWQTRFPEHEDQLRDMLRALQPCDFKAGKGCVPVDTAPAASASAGR